MSESENRIPHNGLTKVFIAHLTMTNEPEVLAEDTKLRGAERGRREPKLLGVGGDRQDELTGRSTT